MIPRYHTKYEEKSFIELTVIGLGFIVVSLSLDLKRFGFAEEIGVDNNLTYCKKILELSLVDRVEPLESAIQISDIIIFAVPIEAILKMLAGILDLIPYSITVVDMGSIKKATCWDRSKSKKSKTICSIPYYGWNRKLRTSCGIFL